MKSIFLFAFLFLSTSVAIGQEVCLGFKDSIQSEVLHETRKFTLKLPKGYAQSNKSYPVLYRLDGDLNLYTETVGTVNRLAYMDELVPEMIVVMVENTNRNRDMMPTNTGFFTAEPGADNFVRFLEEELVTHINTNYRTNKEKILCGQSLSALFTIYYFLTSPDSFDSFIACSGGFPGCEDFFTERTNDFLSQELEQPVCLFLTHGMTDFLDPEGIIKKQVEDFSSKIKTKNNMVCKLKIYEDEGHVPFQSLYHGLRFIYSKTDKK